MMSSFPRRQVEHIRSAIAVPSLTVTPLAATVLAATVTSNEHMIRSWGKTALFAHDTVRSADVTFPVTFLAFLAFLDVVTPF